MGHKTSIMLSLNSTLRHERRGINVICYFLCAIAYKIICDYVVID